jgi:hypothetical protein
LDHVVTFDAAYDHVLLLINDTLQLGLDPRDCRDQLLLRHDRIRRTVVSTRLEAIRRLSEKHRGPRNLWLHRGEKRQLHEALGLQELYPLEVHWAAKDHGIRTLPVRQLRTDLQIEAKKMSAILEDEADALERGIVELMDVLHPVAQKIAAALDDIEAPPPSD